MIKTKAVNRYVYIHLPMTKTMTPEPGDVQMHKATVFVLKD